MNKLDKWKVKKLMDLLRIIETIELFKIDFTYLFL